MKKYILISLSLLNFIFSSCEEVIEYKLDTADARLVVEGLITDQPGPYQLRISNSRGYLEEGSTAGVNGALVIISDSEGTTDTLTQVNDGLYQTTKLQGKAGNTYYLKALVNGETYTAQSYMPAVAPLDSLTFEYKADGHMQEEGYYPYIHFGDPAGKGNFYRWNVYINGELAPDELAVLNDDLYDGSYGHASMQFALKPGDKLRVEMYGVDKPAYEFWYALVNQQNSTGSPFESTPANAPGNISNGAMGYFGASAVTVAEGVAE
ncbi:DUF4249 domain-containing protein [Cesiribacter sp. SM1]|uniref:DUF4249 domain-containing protein n=1 Tax=Cesiribacter sp. SM1 TaxID=2861196 RepID=UPI001CD66CFC|nr:DUF4249 domain-containing protein [Cesiribacter sp. SM1]